MKIWRSVNHGAFQIRRKVLNKVFTFYFQVALVVVEIVSKTAKASIELKFLVHSTTTFFPSTKSEGIIGLPIVGLQIGGKCSFFYILFFCLNFLSETYPAGICLFKINNGNTRILCQICSKLTKTLFIVNFEQISHIVLVFPFLILNR